MGPALLSILFGAALTIASCYALGVILLRRTPAPPEIALAVGAAVQSLLVFVVLAAGIARWPVFLALGLAPLAALPWLRQGFRPHPLPQPPKLPLGRKEQLAALIIFGAYGAWYLVNAMAPETLADGLTYHLGLPYQFVRLGRFPSRITFYGIMPLGMEMLYTMAFAFGRHSAARLVEFALFVATPPLILRIGRRLGMSDLAGLTAAVLYFCAPVVGLTGATSYNDAAVVVFSLAAFYLLLVWRDTSSLRYVALAGLAAGFCYAVKFPGIFTVAAAGLFVVARRRGMAVALFAAGAAVAMAPWVLRAALLTGNPVAPLMDGVFPNPYFHVLTDRDVSSFISSLGAVTPLRVPWELAFGDGLMGTFGPLLFALPLALAAARSRAGRLCLLAALILALPWISNKGARFLMPSFVFAALALGMVLPRRAAWAAIAVQAVLCWPQSLNLWQPEWTFRLHEFPLHAALRLEPEAVYVPRHAPEYAIAKMLEYATPPGARTFSFDPVAHAYLARDVTVSWQSAEGDRVTDTLRLASVYRDDPLYQWSGTWPPTLLRALRFRLPAARAAEWDISEVELYSEEDRVYNSPQWTLRAWPNPWEAPAAFDGNRATRWRTWEPIRAGMYLEIDFDHPQRLTSAVLLSHTPVFRVALEFYGQGTDRRWRLLSNTPSATALPREDLRLEAAEALRRAGFRYVMAPDDNSGYANVGHILAQDPQAWGMEPAGYAGTERLFRIR